MCHYADSDGYLTDQRRPVAWRYRDWLVRALNQDLPFDQFTIHQLAGDLLPDATQDQKLATGFLRQTLSNREGGADLEEFRVLQVVDRTEMVHQAEVLKHHADAPSHRRQLFAGDGREVLAEQGDKTASGLQRKIHDLEQRGLASAARTGKEVK